MMKEFHELFVLDDIVIPVKISKYNFKKGDYTFAPHWHKKLEILYMLDGSMQIVCNNEIFQVFKGDIVVMNPFDTHSAQCNYEDIVYECIIVDTDIFISNKLDACDQSILQLQSGSLRINSCISNDERLTELLETIIQEEKNPSRNYPIVIKSCLYQFLCYCICHCVNVKIDSSHINKDAHAITKLLEYLHLNYSMNITSKDMAELCGYSHSYFCRYFKSIVGKSPVEYLNSVRVKKAYKMLHETNMNITEIALATGYSSLNYFGRQFKSVMNCSPKDLRKSGTGQ